MNKRNWRKTLIKAPDTPTEPVEKSTDTPIAPVGKKGMSLAEKVSVVGLIVTILLAAETLVLQIKSDRQGQKIQDFEKLLTKTDNVLSDLNAQLPILSGVLKAENGLLEVNGKIQSIANINQEYALKSNRNRFFVALCQLAILLKFKDEARLWDSISQDVFILNAKSIFENQAVNPYIMQNDTLSKYWRNASNALNLFSNENVFDSTFSDEFYGRTRTRLDEISNSVNSEDRTFNYCWDKVNQAFSYGVRVYKSDKK